MLQRRTSYDALVRDFAWNLPAHFNIGTAISDAWASAEPDRIALIEQAPDGRSKTLSFGEFSRLSNALAAGLRRAGIVRGDRVALLLPQGFEAAIAHAAIGKLGAVAVPLALLFGAQAIEYRLRSAGAKALIANAAGFAKLRSIEKSLPALDLVLVTDAPGENATDFWRLVRNSPAEFQAENTGPDDPAMMIFTSGTTGPPKGALHGQRVLLGHLPGIAMAQEGMPQPGDLLWTPADWAWAGGLLNALLPSLYWGVPVLAAPTEKFDGEAALGLMEKWGVRNAFLPPTALRMLRLVPDLPRRFGLKLRSIGSAGESLGRDTFEWAQSAFGLTVNEFYGQTECNAVLGSCAGLGIARAGAIGKPVPGHRVALLDAEGRQVEGGRTGSIAIRRPDPVMFLGYWEDEEATREKFLGDWMLTGDQAREDADGYFHFFGRDDDIITSSGYRIGPSEIEDCLSGHPAVAMSAAIGKPDPLRTEIVKAYVVLKATFAATPQLTAEIQHWVRERLSAHEYPREIAFVDKIPLTTSGKVIRRAFREQAQAEAEAL